MAQLQTTIDKLQAISSDLYGIRDAHEDTVAYDLIERAQDTVDRALADLRSAVAVIKQSENA